MPNLNYTDNRYLCDRDDSFQKMIVFFYKRKLKKDERITVSKAAFLDKIRSEI